jgi:hypothetical protein
MISLNTLMRTLIILLKYVSNKNCGIGIEKRKKEKKKKIKKRKKIKKKKICKYCIFSFD